MPRVTKPYIFSAGALVIAAQINSNFDTLYNLVNGGLDETNITGGSLPSTAPDLVIDGSDASATYILTLDGGVANSIYDPSTYIIGGSS